MCFCALVFKLLADKRLESITSYRLTVPHRSVGTFQRVGSPMALGAADLEDIGYTRAACRDAFLLPSDSAQFLATASAFRAWNFWDLGLARSFALLQLLAGMQSLLAPTNEVTSVGLCEYNICGYRSCG